MSYSDLTEGERAHWDEYETLRQITDWPGFDEAQDIRKHDARDWLVAKRKDIWRLAQPKSEGGDGQGWDHANRRERYEFLKDDNLNSGAPKHEVRLPAPGSCTDTEKVYIEEREGYLTFGSTTDAQKERKLENSDWLVARRKDLWHLMEDDPDGNGPNDRKARYDALCIATRHDCATFEKWDEEHNKWGQPYTEQDSGTSGRSACKDWLDSYLGVHENPDGSNRGSPQPDKWENRVYGSSGVPWCACFAGCSSWDNGVSGSVTAGVYNNTQMAKQGQGIYRGYTTDPSKVHAGDHAFISDDHTGVIYDRDTGQTVEGNTSASGGSQWNGGQVAKKTRGWGYWTGFGLVRYPE
jgi:hypothetical protein